MCLDDQLGSGSLKAYTTFNADDGVADVTVAANSIRSTDFLNLLDGFNLVIKVLAVDGDNLSLLESDFQGRFFLLGGMFEISVFGQSLCRIQQFTAANACAPDTYIVAVFQFREVCEESVLVQIVHLFLTCQFLVTCQCDDFYPRSHDEERHVETDLVVTGTC